MNSNICFDRTIFPFVSMERFVPFVSMEQFVPVVLLDPIEQILLFVPMEQFVLMVKLDATNSKIYSIVTNKQYVLLKQI